MRSRLPSTLLPAVIAVSVLAIGSSATPTLATNVGPATGAATSPLLIIASAVFTDYAYVLIGDAQRPSLAKLAAKAANEAQSDFQKAGYTVKFNASATSADVIAAVNDPCTRALWFLGHGGYSPSGNPVPELYTQGGFITPSSITANSNIKEVTLHACGQDLPEWSAKFPSAAFNAWSFSVPVAFVIAWQWFKTYSPPFPSLSQAIGAPPTLHPLLRYEFPAQFQSVPGGFIADWEAVASSNFSLHPSLLATIGSLRLVNEYAEDSMGGTFFLHALEIQSGVPVRVSSDIPHASPDWEVFYGEGFGAVLEDPYTYYEQVANGVIRVEVHAAGLTVEDVVNVVGGTIIGQPPAAKTYCAPKPNVLGCEMLMSSTGVASFTNPAPFLVEVQEAVSNKSGIFFYGLNGTNAKPYHGGTLCVKGPYRRTPMQNSGGNPPPDDCSGTFSLDFNARIQSGVDPSLVPGATVNVQTWCRQGGGTGVLGLSDAIQFAVGP